MSYFTVGFFTDLTKSCGSNMDQYCTCQSTEFGFFTQYDRTCGKTFDDNPDDGYQFQVIASICTDGDSNSCYCGRSSSEIQSYIMVDFGQSVDVTAVEILSSNTEWDWRPKNFDIVIGDSTTMTDNVTCATNKKFVDDTYDIYRTFGCVGRGQYLFIRQGLFYSNYLQITEMLVAGSIPEKNKACVACLAGTFKPTNGSGVCTDCVADTYSTETGRNSSYVPCQTNTMSTCGSASQAY